MPRQLHQPEHADPAELDARLETAEALLTAARRRYERGVSDYLPVLAALFLLYLWGISFIPDIRRVFAYHGAEHKSIYTYERGLELTAEKAAEIYLKAAALGQIPRRLATDQLTALAEKFGVRPDPEILRQVEDQHLAPIRFVDDGGEVTESYPHNPNGSPRGIAGLCSSDGRHLAMMPHPERCFMKWQWGWMPRRWRWDLKASPWLRLFQNARQWCEEN